jgi:hypothetical protein
MIEESGFVPPSGLLDLNNHSPMAGFNKSYKNTSLRVGVIIETYPIKHDRNKSKLTTEYDVLVMEQNEDRGATSILYRNCMSSEGLGSIADFLERTLRKKKQKKNKGDSVNLKDQNGAIVLLLCLDSMSDKAVIVGALTHPDRKTTLKDEDPHLEGEYNGLNIKVEKDGSATLTFKGATDNDGKIIDKNQGNTTAKIEKDGSLQIDHKTIKLRLDKKGIASLTADGDISNTSKKNFNVIASENITEKATKNYSLQCADSIVKATGSSSITCQKMSIEAQSEIMQKGSQYKVEAASMVNIKSPMITIDGIVALGGAGGQPVLLLSTIFMGTGNEGAPVISNAISGYAVKVTAV